MAKLAQCMSPILTDDIIELLRKRKIFTFVDVLEVVPEELRNISGLPFKDILALRSDIISRCCPLPRSGIEVQNDCLSNSAIIPSGIKDFDDILGGGFPTGQFVEISGESATGKTYFCLVMAINAAKELHQHILWIDSKSGFCARQLYQMLQSKNCDDEELGMVMESIKVVNVNDYYELYGALQDFQDNFSRLHTNIRLVVIDSIPAIFFNFMPDQRVNSISLLDCLVNKMKSIAREFHVTFILVNLTYKKLNEESGSASLKEFHERGNSYEVKVALGKYWSGIPNNRLLIEKTSNNNHKITVLRSNHLPSGVSCVVNLFNN